MREMDTYGLKLCGYQAELFKESAIQLKCSSRVFVRRFMNSRLADRIDANGLYFDATGIPEAFEELDEQYGATEYGKVKYSAEELYWIGYIYRYWCYTYDKSSKQLYKLIKPEELRSLYFPYHSLDPKQAIERIMEAKGLGAEDDIARGVEILRRVRSREQFSE